MQTSFVNGNTNAVRMQDYIRITDGDTAPANMVVPDATENANVNTSTSDMKVSDYRGSIKEKKFTQTGDEEQYDIDLTAYSGVSWNSNLSKNVFKQMIINGRCYSDANSKSSNSAAARFTASDTKNFEIYVLSSANDTDRGIYGASGAGGSGGTGGNDGESGGVALWVDNASSRGTTGKISVKLESNNSRIYGGGGGGGQGGQGNSGGTINCWVDGPRESGNNNNAFPTLAGTLVVANPNASSNKYIVNQHNVNNNPGYSNHAFAGGSDNVGRACSRAAGQCDTNWSWNDTTKGWVTGTIKSTHSGTGRGMVECREWGYNANYEVQNHPNQSDGSTSQRGRCRGRAGERGASYGNASSCTAEWVRRCQYRYTFDLTPTVGGVGGEGGRGEGVGNANANLAAMSGANGGNGQTVTCASNGNSSSSNAGGQGGNGGNWGEAGNNGLGNTVGLGGSKGLGIARTNNSQNVTINGSGNATNCVLGGSGTT